MQLLNRVRLFETPWIAARQASLSSTISQNLLKFMSIESVMPCNHLILCHRFSFSLQSFPSSGAFPMSWLSASDGGQSIGALASVLPMNIQNWFPLELTGWFSLQSQGPSKSSPALNFESINSSVLSLFYGPALTSTHDYWKNHSFDHTDLCLVMSLLFNTLPSFVTVSKKQTTYNFMAEVTARSDLGAEEKKICHCFYFSPSICPEVMGPDAMILVFLMLGPACSLSSFTLIRLAWVQIPALFFPAQLSDLEPVT